MSRPRLLLVFALLLLVFAYSEGKQQQQQQGESPYVFQEYHFTSKYQSQYGRVRVLPKFTDRSNLLRGIENYRFTILEAQPQTFVIPNHWDAETVFFVVQGKGTISLVRPEKRESFNIRRGDIVRIPAGVASYLINRDNNQKLIIANLFQSLSNPGEVEEFFEAGSQEPESFYRTFSTEILEAALNTKRDKLQAVFGQQRQKGVFIKASQEQIRALSHHEEGGIWPFGGERKELRNIFQKGPSQSNKWGQLFEVNEDDFRQLRDLDLAFSFANITKGGMAGPLYNSKTTKFVFVVSGQGDLEMACPHLSSQSQGSQQGQQGEWQGSQGQQGQGEGQGSRGQTTGSQRYQKVTARLRPGVAFIVPPGHPWVNVASNNQNLELACFEIFASGNERIPLVGKRNIIKQFEREAKELAFGGSARIVDEVFGNQEEEFFYKGPSGRQQQEGGRSDA